MFAVLLLQKFQLDFYLRVRKVVSWLALCLSFLYKELLAVVKFRSKSRVVLLPASQLEFFKVRRELIIRNLPGLVLVRLGLEFFLRKVQVTPFFMRGAGFRLQPTSVILFRIRQIFEISIL